MPETGLAADIVGILSLEPELINCLSSFLLLFLVHFFCLFFTLASSEIKQYQTREIS